MESEGNAAFLRAGMWCTPGRRPPSQATRLPARAQPPSCPVGPGERLLNNFKRVRSKYSFVPFPRGSALEVGPDPLSEARTARQPGGQS